MTEELIAILTDFGTTDPFVGIMKGVISHIAPGVPTIDITHEVPPGDLRRAAVLLWQALPYFPPTTVFLVVVDPGVGTARKGIICQQAGGSGPRLVGPDNGVFSRVFHPGWQVYELSNPALVAPAGKPARSRTFHGRDIFAPAAARAALGMAASEFGPAVPQPVRLPAPRLTQPEPGVLEGEVLFADRFGNLLTSLGQFEDDGEKLHLQPWLPGLEPAQYRRAGAWVELPGSPRLPIVSTFADAPPGQPAALIGSTGLIELIANRLSAAHLLDAPPGNPVRFGHTP